jgi:protease-4
VLQRRVDWIYSQFITKVCEGRKLKASYVEEIAQGRVWSGAEAKKLGLVDEIGGLNDALRYAGAQAHLPATFRVSEFPRSKNLSEALAEMFGRYAPASLRLRSTGIVGEIVEGLESVFARLHALNDPQGVYARMPMDIAVH